MKETKKTAIIVAVIMIAVGIVSSVCAIAAMSFDFANINTVAFEINTYTVDEAFTAISIDGAECDINLYPSEDGTCKVVCRESDKISHTVSVTNNTLTIKRHDNRRWYEHIGVYMSSMEIALYLPENEYEKLYAKNLSGNILAPSNFSFETAEVQSTSGNITFKASVSGALSAKTVSGELYICKTDPSKLTAQSTSGDITIDNIDIESNVNIKAVSGDIELSNVKCQGLTVNTTSGDIELLDCIASGSVSIESVSGNTELRRCDADSLWLKTSSGDIYGSLLSDKIFITNTTSGNVNVPHCTTGGRCEITTTGGDIEFEIK